MTLLLITTTKRSRSLLYNSIWTGWALDVPSMEWKRACTPLRAIKVENSRRASLDFREPPPDQSSLNQRRSLILRPIENLICWILSHWGDAIRDHQVHAHSCHATYSSKAKTTSCLRVSWWSSSRAFLSISSPDMSRYHSGLSGISKQNKTHPRASR